ncbi:MAG: alpha/beta hydrolase [Desulfovibrionaceae bacterium]|nr:alpha/beta hydrolase [Desulfovibrionaceae bacterium]MDD4952755.1 alpha/beta hydrolase [Desulfovibrionaceae bacterium]
MTRPRLIWSHGRDSAPWGTKSTALARAAQDLGLDMQAVDYTDLADPDHRVQRLVERCRGQDGPLLLAGSSMGGYVSACAALELRVQGLFLLAPAVFLPGYGRQDFSGLVAAGVVVHGWRDEVVPVDNAIRLARERLFGLHVLDGDHRLTANLPEIVALFTAFLQAPG